MTAGRGIGAVDALRRTLPDWGAEALVFVTQLGDVWFAVGLVTLVYWFHGRRAGAAYLALVRSLAGDDPLRAGGAAAVLALAGVAVGGESDAVMLLGGTVGTLVAWWVVDVPAEPWNRAGIVPAAIGTVVVGVALVVGYGGSVVPPLAFVIGAGAVAAVIALPAWSSGRWGNAATIPWTERGSRPGVETIARRAY